jgi:7-cyano-7-deazaguanine tRNA-ribosyltransferase
VGFLLKDIAIPDPLFLPVFKYGNSFISSAQLKDEFDVGGIITNGYLLYKDRAYRKEVKSRGIKDFLDFDRLIVTDSGAFQQFSGPLYLSNSQIITFQQDIGADIISPLDVITTPGDNRTSASKKLAATLKRIEQGRALVDGSILIGVQQGGRFLDLRGQALHELVQMGILYIALGSLVPFFNKQHDIDFIGRVLIQAREIVPPSIPIHIYGAGDPVELPFYIALGCNIFDSSAFIHYARDGWCMTPYGAFKETEARWALEYSSASPYVQQAGQRIWDDVNLLTAHNLWTVLHVVATAGALHRENKLHAHLDHIAEVHQQRFPQSQLARSWQRLRQE